MKLLLASAVVLTLAGCQSQTNNKVVDAAKPIAKEAITWQQAKVVKLTQVTGTYGLINDKGEKLLPINLPDEFKRENIKVNVYGTKQKELLTQVRWGVPFRIQQINLLKN